MTTETLTQTKPPVDPVELPALEIKPGQDILALLNNDLPDVNWDNQDDLCDCTFQRIGHWTNPYIGRTMIVRLCCLWAELAKQYPQFVQEIPAFYNFNEKKWDENGPHDWNGELDMPRAIWHRQLAVKSGLSLERIRKIYEDKEPPKGTPRTPTARQAVRELIDKVRRA